MNFGIALQAMKEGKKLTRAGWNGKGLFVYYVPAGVYKAQTSVARETFGDNVSYTAYLAIRTAQGDVAPWSPSQTDVLAEDWSEVV